MLSHRLRAEEDAILVGRVTNEREHPLLNVRDWKGKDPKRIVLQHGMEIQKLLSDLYEDNIQSLIVEGGRKILQSFIDANLWDEIRVETAPFVVSDGTPSPILPPEACENHREEWDENTIVWYNRGC